VVRDATNYQPLLVEIVRWPATIFATQLANIGRDWKVLVGLRRILKPNKINHFGMSADYSVLPHENCKTVYTSSILVVASINKIK
jgi:hypothetical protein